MYDLKMYQLLKEPVGITGEQDATVNLQTSKLKVQHSQVANIDTNFYRLLLSIGY